VYVMLQLASVADGIAVCGLYYSLVGNSLEMPMALCPPATMAGQLELIIQHYTWQGHGPGAAGVAS
jgi:hypothetical protein